jgi:hypothetical protein
MALYRPALLPPPNIRQFRFKSVSPAILRLAVLRNAAEMPLRIFRSMTSGAGFSKRNFQRSIASSFRDSCHPTSCDIERGGSCCRNDPKRRAGQENDCQWNGPGWKRTFHGMEKVEPSQFTCGFPDLSDSRPIFYENFLLSSMAVLWWSIQTRSHCSLSFSISSKGSRQNQHENLFARSIWVHGNPGHS